MKNLKALRLSNNLTQEKLSNILNIGRTTYTQYETGVSEPDISMLIKIADYFNVTVDYILDKEVKSNTGIIKIPVLKYLNTDKTLLSLGHTIDYEEIIKNDSETSNYFGFKIDDNSMEPLIFKNDIVIVKYQDNVENKEIGIVTVGNNNGICRKIFRHNKGISLIALNTQFEPEFFTHIEIKKIPIKIMGKVIELKRKF